MSNVQTDEKCDGSTAWVRKRRTTCTDIFKRCVATEGIGISVEITNQYLFGEWLSYEWAYQIDCNNIVEDILESGGRGLVRNGTHKLLIALKVFQKWPVAAFRDINAVAM